MSTKNLTQFEATNWAKHTVAMDRNLENYDFSLKDANVKILKKKILTMSLSHINVTNATILLLRHAI